MKILVADKFEASGLEGLAGLGEVVSNPDLKDEALVDAIRETGADVLVVRSTKVTEAMLASGRLRLVIRAGAGYNTIDVDAASRRGILVSNCPGKNSLAVAELAFGLLLAIDRRIPDNVAQLREGRWNKKEFGKSRGLYGRTLGLVGLGRIGQAMIQRAQAFGMHVIAFSRWLTPDVAAALGVGRADSLESLASRSDVVSVHVSLTPETRGILGEAFFEAMRPGGIFINASRAEVVDQDALLEAIERKNLFAGLDVFEGEPAGAEGTYEGPLQTNPRVYCTHHIGASTDQAQEAVADETVRIVGEYKATGAAPNLVNVSRAECATHLVTVRHEDRVGALSHLLEILREQGVNIQEMETTVLGGSHAAIAQIAGDHAPSADAVNRIKEHPAVFDVSVHPIDGSGLVGFPG